MEENRELFAAPYFDISKAIMVSHVRVAFSFYKKEMGNLTCMPLQSASMNASVLCIDETLHLNPNIAQADFHDNGSSNLQCAFASTLYRPLAYNSEQKK